MLSSWFMTDSPVVPPSPLALSTCQPQPQDNFKRINQEKQNFQEQLNFFISKLLQTVFSETVDQLLCTYYHLTKLNLQSYLQYSHLQEDHFES